MGVRQARAHGLTGANAEDAAMEFVLWIYTHRESRDFSEALLETSAHHRVVEFIRRQHRVQSHELTLSGCDSQLHIHQPERLGAVDPEELAIKSENRRELLSAALEMPLSRQNLFLRYFIEEETVSDLARAGGCNENTLRQRLFVIRNHFRKRLSHWVGPSEDQKRGGGNRYFSYLARRDMRSFRRSCANH